MNNLMQPFLFPELVELEPPTYEETHKYDPEDLRDDIQKQIDSLVGEEVAWVSITVNDVVADC